MKEVRRGSPTWEGALLVAARAGVERLEADQVVTKVLLVAARAWMVLL